MAADGSLIDSREIQTVNGLLLTWSSRVTIQMCELSMMTKMIMWRIRDGEDLNNENDADED